jgi:DNA-binding MarR family transcriptional regulator
MPRADQIRDKRRPSPKKAAPPEIDLGSLGSALGYVLMRASRDVGKRFKSHFEHLDLTSRQYAILVLVDANPEITASGLVEPLGLGQNNLTAIIDGLIERGILEKQLHSGDRRSRVLSITASGKDLLQRGHEAEARLASDHANRLGQNSLAQLISLLSNYADDRQ